MKYVGGAPLCSHRLPLTSHWFQTLHLLAISTTTKNYKSSSRRKKKENERLRSFRHPRRRLFRFSLLYNGVHPLRREVKIYVLNQLRCFHEIERDIERGCLHSKTESILSFFLSYSSPEEVLFTWRKHLVLDVKNCYYYSISNFYFSNIIIKNLTLNY